MAPIQGGNKSESEEEPVFQNTENPLKDTAVTTLECKVRLRKKDVTSSVNKIVDAVKIINKAASGGSLNGNNLVVTGYITTGAGLIEKSRHEYDRLETVVAKIDCMYKQIELQLSDQFSEEVRDKLNKLESDLEDYRKKVSTVIEESVNYFKDENIRSSVS